MGALHKGAQGNRVLKCLIEAAGLTLDFCEDSGGGVFDTELEAGELVF